MDNRILTESEKADYQSRLLAVGFTLSPLEIPEPVGFDIRAVDGSVSYGYRYDENYSSAVALMDKICSERGA